MKIRYSLSHILLVVTIVALICAWVIERRNNDALTNNLNETRSKLAKTIYTTKEYLLGAQWHLDNLKSDGHFNNLAPFSRGEVQAVNGTFVELVRKGNETLDSEGLRGYGIGTSFSPALDRATLSIK